MKKLMIVWMMSLAVSGFAAERTLTNLKSELQSALVAQYGTLAQSPVSSGVFYDLVLPLSGLARLDGSDAEETCDRERWLQAVHELRRASFDERELPPQEILRELSTQASRERAHPLGLLWYGYQTARDQSMRDDLIMMEDGVVSGVRGELLTRHTVFAAALLNDYSYHGSACLFRMSRAELFFTNQGPLASLEIDFDDGLGFRAVPQDGDVMISYRQTGVKTIHIRARAAGGLRLFGRTRFDVRSLDAPPPTETWQVTAGQSYQGITAQGEAYVYLSDQNSSLTRPVILVEGLDLNNSLNWDEIYDLMNQELLLETLRSLGFDVVVLNYGNSTTYAQANAYLVEQLIRQVNAVTGGSPENVIVGTSLGGVTTRYALAHMESNNEAHHCRAFLSVDSPQRGANIPIGLQYWADFFAGQSVEAAAARDALLTPAPRQLLLYHMSSSSGEIATPDPLRAGLMSELGALGGYPLQTRNVSICNGSGTQQNSGFLPGAQLIRWEYNSLLIDIRGNVWAVHNAARVRVLQGLIDVIWPLPDESRNVYIQPCLPWDNAPGGLTASMAELAAIDPGYGDIVALHPAHCFIPTVSALDLSVGDPFFNVAGAPDIYALTEFDAVYFPQLNQDHVAITPENAAWFLTEIVGPLESPVVTIAAAASGDVTLRWSSVFGARSYRIFRSSVYGSWPQTYAQTDTTVWLTAATADAEFFYVEARLDTLVP